MSRRPFLRAYPLVISLIALLGSMRATSFAASSGSTALQIVQGSGAERENGDYVSAANALDAAHSFFVEVPPGLPRLDIDVFDADVGMGGNNESTRDRLRSTSWNTSTRYRVYDPDGVQRTTLFNSGDRNGPAGSDNAWKKLLSTTTDVVPGHWEVRVDSSSDITSGNDVNGFGLRAHDGSADGSGHELNIYIPSFGSYGANLSNVTSVYTQYPYVTAGCTFDVNDFDFDKEQNPISASIALTSPGGTFSYKIENPSTNDVWLQTPIAGWDVSTTSSGYGIWTMTTRISGPAGAGNYANIYLGDDNGTAPPPASQPVPQSFRIYLPADSGTAPRLPFVQQTVIHVAGPNPPVPGSTSRFSVRVRVSNPGADAIDVERVEATVPGGDVTYAGNATATAGSIVSQPAGGGSGAVAWDPGILATGVTADLSYEVTLAPASTGERLSVTGTPDAGGTTARFIDSSCTAAGCTGARLANATYEFGPLCEIALVAGSVPTPTNSSTPPPTSSPTQPSAPAATATFAAIPPTSTFTAIPTTPTFTAIPPTPTEANAPLAVETETPADTDTPTPTETATIEATSEPTESAEPTATSEAPRCGDGRVDASEECDDGADNDDTTPDACRNDCTLPRCGDGIPDTPTMDLVIVIETSLSMQTDLRRLVTSLGPLPEQLAEAGVDYRLAVVRFATGHYRHGPDRPEILFDFATDGDTFRGKIDTLRSQLTGPTESGTEAFDLALDELHLRPNAIPVFLLFSDEDDDLPISIERRARREPPGGNWMRSARASTFQDRIDEVADRLIQVGARLVMLVNPRDKPVEHQYGSPRSTVIDSEGRLDIAATRAALASRGFERSLQGQVLASGVCEDSLCARGKIGTSCESDDDCALPARAYPILQARDRNRDAFFQMLRQELVAYGSCAP